MNLLKSVVPVALFCATAFSAYAASIDGLIVDLSGNDEHVRAVARQLLPREGAAAVPKLLVLLRNDDPKIWWAANAVLRDILNQVAVPGLAKEHEDVAAQVVALLDPKETPAVKERALRLLPIAVAPKTDLAPMAPLLDDAELREKAREALGEINNDAAAAVLATALEKADPEFQVALLNTGVHMRKAKLATASRQLLKSESPEVRAAAARAVAWSGHLGLVASLSKVLGEATAETEFDAADALLRLCDSVAREGGNYETVLPIYRDVLAKVGNPVIKATALIGLGTYGDETVIPEILAAASGDAAAELQGPALQALDQQTGRAAANTLLAAYSRAENEMKALLLQMYGRKKDAIYLPALNEALNAPDAALRNAAIIGLRDTALPEAANALGDYAQEAADADKPAAIEALQSITSGLVQAGKTDEAGRAYLALYHAANTDELKKAAFEGIKQYPVPESFEVLIQDMDVTKAGGLSVKNLAGMHKALLDAKRDDDASKVEGLLLAQLTTKENTAELVAYARKSGIAPRWAGKLGAITKWQIVGPFPFNMKEGFVTPHVNEPNIDLAAKYPGSGGEVAWQPRDGDPLDGLTDLTGPYGMQSGACCYAFAKITVPEAIAAQVRTGSDDGIKVWVDGKQVQEKNVDRGYAPDSDQADVQLQAGENTVLCQISQGGGGWNFGVRFTKPDGTPLAFTQP